MLKMYYLDCQAVTTSDQQVEEQYQRLLGLFPKTSLHKPRAGKQKRNWVYKMLLLELAGESIQKNFFSELSINPQGKEQHPNCFISCSDTDDCIFVALADFPIGIDSEKFDGNAVASGASIDSGVDNEPTEYVRGQVDNHCSSNKWLVFESLVKLLPELSLDSWQEFDKVFAQSLAGGHDQIPGYQCLKDGQLANLSEYFPFCFAGNSLAIYFLEVAGNRICLAKHLQQAEEEEGKVKGKVKGKAKEQAEIDPEPEGRWPKSLEKAKNAQTNQILTASMIIALINT